jgi:hypothetical protein
MNSQSNVKVTVVIPSDADLHLLDEVLARVNGRDSEIAIQFEQPRNLQSQISEWLTAVFGRPA